MSDNDIDFDKRNANEIPETEFKPVTAWEMDKQAKKHMEEFDTLLNSLDKSLDKKKKLWKQVYENSVIDRKNAYLVFADLYVQVHGRSAEHAIHGQTLSKYMERMSKATDQLLKLAELVAAAEENTPSEHDERLTDEEIYSAIQGNKPKH